MSLICARSFAFGRSSLRSCARWNVILANFNQNRPACLNKLATLSQDRQSHNLRISKTLPITIKALNIENFAQIRLFSTGKPDPPKATESKEETQNEDEVVKNDFNLSGDPTKSLFQKFKDNCIKYWYVMIPVHCVTSSIWFIGFCWLASVGISPVPLLEYFGCPEEYLKAAKESAFGIIAVALLFQKISAPLRYLTTWFTVKALAERGMLMSSTQFRKFMKEKFAAFQAEQKIKKK